MEDRYRKQTLEAIKKCWQPSSSTPLTDDEVIAIADNLCQFFMALEDINKTMSERRRE